MSKHSIHLLTLCMTGAALLLLGNWLAVVASRKMPILIGLRFFSGIVHVGFYVGGACFDKHLFPRLGE